MLVLGLSGWVRRCTEAAPMPIVMAMVAGVFLRFGLDLVFAVRDDFWIAVPMILAFILLSYSARLGRLLPPVLGALVAGALAVALLGKFQPPAALFAFAAPNFYAPAFSWQAMFELVVPLAITVLVVQNGQGFAVLTAAGHKPPMDAIAAACGGVSIVTACMGAVSTCLTGPVNAIVSSGGEKHRHYTGAVLVGLLALVFGLLSPFFTRLLLATPQAFIAVLGGLAMLRVQCLEPVLERLALRGVGRRVAGDADLLEFLLQRIRPFREDAATERRDRALHRTLLQRFDARRVAENPACPSPAYLWMGGARCRLLMAVSVPSCAHGRLQEILFLQTSFLRPGAHRSAAFRWGRYAHGASACTSFATCCISAASTPGSTRSGCCPSRPCSRSNSPCRCGPRSSRRSSCTRSSPRPGWCSSSSAWSAC
jgi:hypothetical protein